MIGNFDGDAGNDLALRDGTLLKAPSVQTIKSNNADAWLAEPDGA